MVLSRRIPSASRLTYPSTATAPLRWKGSPSEVRTSEVRPAVHSDDGQRTGDSIRGHQRWASGKRVRPVQFTLQLDSPENNIADDDEEVRTVGGNAGGVRRPASPPQGTTRSVLSAPPPRAILPAPRTG